MRGIARNPNFDVTCWTEVWGTARLGMMVSHPNVIATYEVGRDEKGRAFHAQELVEYDSLKYYVYETGTQYRVDEMVDIARGMAAGIDAVHEAGIVIRDVAPLWFTVSDDDSGRRSARLLMSGAAIGPGGLTGERKVPGRLVGTPRYMAPEQGRGEDVDYRADLYSFGLILYQMLTGYVPFDYGNDAKMLLGRSRDPAPRLRDMIPSLDVTDRLEDALVSLIERDPGARASCATEVVEAMVS